MATPDGYVELVEYIHPALLNLDYRKSSVKIMLVLASAVVFFVVYGLSAVVASFTWTYRNLRVKEKIFWNMAVVRAVFGIFASIIGIWALLSTTPLDSDVVFGTTATSYFAITVTTGFFVFECSALTVTSLIYKKWNFLLNLHHWLSLAAYSTTLWVESTHCFAMKGLILEMSTPFSALCWTLLKCGMEQSLLWKANQFLLVHTFHCRSIVECYLWYLTYQNWNYIWAAMPLSIFVQLYFELSIVSLVLTPYWTYKKTAQMINPVDWNFEDSNSNKSMNGEAKKSI